MLVGFGVRRYVVALFARRFRHGEISSPKCGHVRALQDGRAHEVRHARGMSAMTGEDACLPGTTGV
jgi:hypothetical protein